MSKNLFFKARLLLAAELMLATATPVAHATIFSWSQSSSGSWHTATNWLPNGLPGNGDTVKLTNGGNYTVWLTNGAPGVTLSSLIIGGSGAATLLVTKATPLVAGNCVITNGGTLVVSSNSQFLPSAWTIAAGGAFVLDSSATLPAPALSLTNSGSLFVNNNATFTLSNCTLNAGGTLTVDGYATLTAAKYFVNAGGVLTLSNAWLPGTLTVAAGGTLNLAAPNNSYIYSLTLTNNGTVNWSSGGLTAGGTTIYNHGLWQITGNNATGYGGGGTPAWVNSGTLRKAAGTGTSTIAAFNFQNVGGVVEAQAGVLEFNGGTTNLLAGLFTNTAPAGFNFINGNWTDAGGFFAGTGTNNFSSGTFSLRTNVPPGLRLAGGDVWITGTNTFQNSGAITNLILDGAALRGTNQVTGSLTMNGGSIPEKLTVQTNAQWIIQGTQNKLLYRLRLFNYGTVICGSSVNVGDGGTIYNAGLWLFTGDHSVSFGGNSQIIWTNVGIVRKTAGTGAAYSSVDANFINQPGGLVESLAGRLLFNSDVNSQLGGTFNAVGMIELNNGTWTDAGGVMTGPGTNRFNAGILNLRTNVPPGLVLAGGTVFITGTNTFQNAGAITNLVLEGSTLAGTNVVGGGTLILKAGTMTGQLTVQPDGELVFTTSASKFITSLALFNRGQVRLSSDSVKTGSAFISNSGLWQVTGDYALNTGGVGTTTITNLGIFQKTAGNGLAALGGGINFLNQTGAVVQVDSGTLQLPPGTTNLAGTLRLNGGSLNANGTFAVTGGRLEGKGIFGAHAFTGGTLSPGLNDAGRISFPAGLNLNSNATLIIDGSGPAPGTAYDQLTVTGAVVLAQCSLQVTALPNVPAGTKFIVIDNDGVDAVGGTFAGLPENAPLTVGAQTFHIHYADGTGNDVALVRAGVMTGPWLVFQGMTNGSWIFNANGAIPLTPYTVRASTNLVTWTNLAVTTSSISGTFGFTDTNAWRYSRRFYNVTN
jgi:hypothetical protein